MSRHHFTLILVLCTVAICAHALQGAPEEQAVNQQCNELSRRIDQGDYSAIHEAIQLPGSMAARFLWLYAHSDGADPQVRIKALEAIKLTHNFKDYYQQKLTDMAEKGEAPLRVYDILIAIGNHEAAAVVAPDLFECGTLTPDGKLSGKVLNMRAAWVFGKMHFPDAPSAVDPYEYGPDENIAWQKWAIAHGMVPKAWEARVGVPEWQYRTDPNRERREARASILHPSGDVKALPDPSESIRIWPPKPATGFDKSRKAMETARPLVSSGAASETAQSRGGWALWAGIAAAVAATAGWLLLKRKGWGGKG